MRCTLAGSALCCALAHAQPDASTRALAETMFADARELMDAGRYAEACPKFAESQRLDPAGGTVLNLARCHEKMGLLATAWSGYREAAALARAEKRADRLKFAEQRIKALTPELPRLTVQVPEPSRLPGLVVSVQGAAIGEAAWGTALPVDPGKLVVRVTAPGRAPTEIEVTLAPKERKEVTIPLLESVPEAPRPAPVAPQPPAPAPAPVPAPVADPTEDRAGTPWLGWAIGAVGVIGVGVGTYSGLRAISLRSESDTECPGEDCSDEGIRLNEDAKSAATISNIGFAVGVVGVGVGVYLLLSGSSSATAARPHRERGVTYAAPVALQRGAGVALGGAF